jgi:hypothetical protein
VSKKPKKPKGETSKGGRPSEYDPIYCKMLIDHMAEGYSFESFAGKIGKARATIYNWVEAHSDFADAKAIGVDAGLYFWEKQGIEGLHNQTFKDADGMTVSKSINATVWIFNMKNRHNWRDKNEVGDAEDFDRPLKELSDAELLKRRGNGK